MKAELKCISCEIIENIEVDYSRMSDFKDIIINSNNFEVHHENDNDYIQCKNCKHKTLFDEIINETTKDDNGDEFKLVKFIKLKKGMTFVNKVCYVATAGYVLTDLFLYDISFDLSKINIVYMSSIIISFTLQHELIHLLTAKYFKYKTKLKLTSVTLGEFIKTKHMKAIAIMPLVILSPLYLLLSFLFPDYASVFITLFMINTLGSNNDVKQFLIAKDIKEDVYLQQLDKEVIGVFEKI